MNKSTSQLSDPNWVLGDCTTQNRLQTESYTHPDVVAAYASGRPTYCPQVIQKILEKFKTIEVKELDTLAVDVGCGSGQFTRVLSPYFTKVVGIDPSEPQLSEAQNNRTETNIEYRLGTCYDLGVADNSVHVITVGTAIHRFTEIDAFLKEVDRCLIPGGIFSYFVIYLKAKEPLCKANQIVGKYLFDRENLGRYWSPEVNKIVIDEYSTIPMIYTDSEKFVIEIDSKLTINKAVQLVKSCEPYGVLKEKDPSKLQNIMDSLVTELKVSFPPENDHDDPMESAFEFQFINLGYICQKPIDH